MQILSIDTSCDETAVAVTDGINVLSNIIWSQASLHAKWGGVVPSLAQREHRERIDWVINKAMLNAKCQMTNIDAIAVTVGPGLAIALEVGISKAKELSAKYNKPLIPVNHIEGHLLSPLAFSRIFNDQFLSEPKGSPSRWPISNNFDSSKYKSKNITFPALGIVTSGGHTEVVLIKSMGDYTILARTADDALGESLDKAARLLGFGYPGGAVLEKAAKEGGNNKFHLPIPMIGREKEMYFSYSGLKTAFVRLFNGVKKNRNNLTKQETADLSAAYQHTAFTHFIRVLEYIIKSERHDYKFVLAGGGVMANVTLRKMLRQLVKKYGLTILFPYSKKLYTDNAAMIGVAAYYKLVRKEYLSPQQFNNVDRTPNAVVDGPFPWET